MISVQPLTGGAAAASYYLGREAGCEHQHHPQHQRQSLLASDRAGAGAGYYVNEHDPAGRWLGRGAAALGLTGSVQQEQAADLRSLLDGTFHGERLAAPVWRHRDHPNRNTSTSTNIGTNGKAGREGEGDAGGAVRVDIRRSGFDVTLSAPKSVSVLLALGSPDVQQHVRDAHAAALDDAIGLLEQLAARAARGHHGDGQRAPRIGTDGLIAAAFEHSTSRAGDPQLHTHVVIANLTRGLDGRWSALDSRTLHRQATTASYLYQARLRGELTRRLGVDWTPVDRGVAEVAGVPLKVRRIFSTRRAQIEAHLQKQTAQDRAGEAAASAGRVGRASRARQLAARSACLITRPAKQHARPESLRERWHAQATDAGFGPEQLADLLTHQHTPDTVDPAALRAAILSSDGVTLEKATFDQGTVLRELCSRLPAGADVTAAELLKQAGELVRDTGVIPVVSSEGRAFTTVEMLQTEQTALELARRPNPGSRDDGDAIDYAQVPAATAARAATRPASVGVGALRPDQQQLVHQLLTSGRPVEVVTGPAGSGKTAALRLAAHTWQAHDVQVAGTSVAALTAQGLEQATGAPSVSLARLLHQPDRHIPHRGVLLVDEAGMIGTRQLLQLLQETQQRRCKVVLVGDPAQLPEMEAGGLFAALTHDPTTLQLHGHHRQRDPWEQQALAALRAGSTAEALDSYDQHGRLHTSTPNDNSHGAAGGAGAALTEQLVADYLRARAAQQDPWQVAVLAARRSDVTDLNTAIRNRLRQIGALGEEALEVQTPDGTIEYRTGDQVLITRNDHQRQLLNGSAATITGIRNDGQGARDGGVTVKVTDGRTLDLPKSWLEQGTLTHGYAMTIHKAQGRTVHTALLLADEQLSAEAGYVGLSRGTHANHLYLHTPDNSSELSGEEQPCRPAPAWTPPTATGRDARRGLLDRSSQQQLASNQLPPARPSHARSR